MMAYDLGSNDITHHEMLKDHNKQLHSILESIRADMRTSFKQIFELVCQHYNLEIPNNETVVEYPFTATDYRIPLDFHGDGSKSEALGYTAEVPTVHEAEQFQNEIQSSLQQIPEDRQTKNATSTGLDKTRACSETVEKDKAGQTVNMVEIPSFSMKSSKCEHESGMKVPSSAIWSQSNLLRPMFPYFAPSKYDKRKTTTHVLNQQLFAKEIFVVFLVHGWIDVTGDIHKVFEVMRPRVKMKFPSRMKEFDKQLEMHEIVGDIKSGDAVLKHDKVVVLGQENSGSVAIDFVYNAVSKFCPIISFACDLNLQLLLVEVCLPTDKPPPPNTKQDWIDSEWHIDIEGDVFEFITKTLNCLPIVNIEHFEEEKLGHADVVKEAFLRDNKIVNITGIKNMRRTTTVLVCGSNQLVVDEAERSLHDALCGVNCLVNKPFLIADGGAPKSELSGQLGAWAKVLHGMERYCVRSFVEALEVIPCTLAVNTGLNPIAIVTELRARHAQGEVRTHSKNMDITIDVKVALLHLLPTAIKGIMHISVTGLGLSMHLAMGIYVNSGESIITLIVQACRPRVKMRSIFVNNGNEGCIGKREGELFMEVVGTIRVLWNTCLALRTGPLFYTAFGSLIRYIAGEGSTNVDWVPSSLLNDKGDNLTSSHFGNLARLETMGTEKVFNFCYADLIQVIDYLENPLLIGNSFMSLHNSKQDCYVDLCSPKVLRLATDNFDYQHQGCHFVKRLLVDEFTGHKTFIHGIHLLYEDSRPLYGSLTGINNGFPCLRSGALRCPFPLSDNIPSYGSLVGPTDIYGSFMHNWIVQQATVLVGYDNALLSQYKEGYIFWNDILTLIKWWMISMANTSRVFLIWVVKPKFCLRKAAQIIHAI